MNQHVARADESAIHQLRALGFMDIVWQATVVNTKKTDARVFYGRRLHWRQGRLV